MRIDQYFPTGIIVLYFAAGLVYAYQGDFRRAVYSFSAAILTASVIY